MHSLRAGEGSTEDGNRENSCGGSRAPGRRGRVKEKQVRPEPGPLTVFIHIPKTAGTTFRRILRANFPPGTVHNTGNVFMAVSDWNTV
jgi:hypothetical protein